MAFWPTLWGVIKVPAIFLGDLGAAVYGAKIAGQDPSKPLRERLSGALRETFKPRTHSRDKLDEALQDPRLQELREFMDELNRRRFVPVLYPHGRVARYTEDEVSAYLESVLARERGIEGLIELNDEYRQDHERLFARLEVVRHDGGIQKLWVAADIATPHVEGVMDSVNNFTRRQVARLRLRQRRRKAEPPRQLTRSQRMMLFFAPSARRRLNESLQRRGRP